MQGEESDAKSDRGYTEEWTSSVTRNMRGMWYKPLSYRTSRTGDARLLGAQAPPRRAGGGVGGRGGRLRRPGGGSRGGGRGVGGQAGRGRGGGGVGWSGGRLRRPGSRIN